MTGDGTNYREAVETIKGAILQAQYAAAKSANAQQLQLYFAVGGYLPHQSEMNAGAVAPLTPSAKCSRGICRASAAFPAEI